MRYERQFAIKDQAEKFCFLGDRDGDTIKEKLRIQMDFS